MARSAVLSNRQIVRAAGIALLGFLASGVLGIVRTAIINSTFGAGAALDAFNTAQRIPELIFVLVAGGALGSSFIPVFARYLRNDDDAQAWRLASATITLSSLAAAVLSLVVLILAPWIVENVLAPGQVPVVRDLTISLIRIMMLTPFIFSISGLMMGILQTYGNFVLPSVAISMNSIGQIIGALVLAHILPPLTGTVAQVGSANVYGLAWGAVLSAVLHLAVQLPGLRAVQTQSPKIRFLMDWRVNGLREVLLMMGPRVLGLGVAQLNFIVNTNFASRMIVGSQAVLTTAWTLMFTILGVIGQSIGTAVFPTLSALAAEGNMEGYNDRLTRALRSVIFLSLPATAGLIVVGGPFVALLFQRNSWTAEDTAGTAWALAFFSIGITGHASLEVLSRAFYALEDSKTPVFIGVLSLVANIVLSMVFIQFIGDPASLARGPFAGLALANSVTTLVEALALWALLRRRIGGGRDRYLLDGIWRTAAATGAMLVILVLFTSLFGNTLNDSLVGIIGGALGVVVFFVCTTLLKMDETSTVLSMILRRIKRS
ncbi:MAG: murein biosynthesis integral membrane protein MurJ [Chloroflexi bacterium]|nr:murein biosynthesis integral membrane protein MurJ [Chloroflexota bacterium]MCC6896523.1 murein biosynthesis integral membrane protein MurJ [Anaerolineae bacterium]